MPNGSDGFGQTSSLLSHLPRISRAAFPEWRVASAEWQEAAASPRPSVVGPALYAPRSHAPRPHIPSAPSPPLCCLCVRLPFGSVEWRVSRGRWQGVASSRKPPFGSVECEVSSGKWQGVASRSRSSVVSLRLSHALTLRRPHLPTADCCCRLAGLPRVSRLSRALLSSYRRSTAFICGSILFSRFLPDSS